MEVLVVICWALKPLPSIWSSSSYIWICSYAKRACMLTLYMCQSGVLPHSQSLNQLWISHPVSVFDKRVEIPNIIQWSHIIFYENKWAEKEMQLLFHLRARLQHELATCLIADNPFIKETLLTISLANLQIDLNHPYISKSSSHEWMD